MLSKRELIISSTCYVAFGARARASTDGDPEYKEQLSFDDYFAPGNQAAFGPGKPTKSDIDTALSLAAEMPTDVPVHVMKTLSSITETGSTGETFNSRWKTLANPLIVLFFHDIGYKKTTFPDDCTPWCAATVSWCLKRCKMPLPPNPASSQSYLRYGKTVDLEDAKDGDLCVFTDIRDHAHGHVTMFIEGGHGDYINCLGGNQEGKSATDCGAGYRKSKIYLSKMQKVTSYHRLVSVRRYT